MPSDTQPLDFDGVTAVVTGASGAIGFAVASTLGRRGAKLLLAGRRAAIIEERVAALRALGIAAQGYTADLGQRPSVREFIDDLGRAAPTGIDALVLAAGEGGTGSVFDVSESDLDYELELNLASHFLIAQAATKMMVAHGRSGRVVFVSSTGAVAAHTNAAVYDATKAALEALARCFAVQLGPHRILANAVQPGNVVNRRQVSDEPTAENRARWTLIPLGRPATADEIAEVIAFLASPRNTYITGEVLRIDGGRTARTPSPDQEELRTIWNLAPR